MAKTKKDIEVIKKKLYPKMKNNINSSTISKFKRNMGKFIEERYVQLYDIAPFDRIPFSEDDAQEFFKLLKIDEDEVRNIIEQTYYGKVANFNPLAAKDPFTILCLSFLRYLILVDKNKKNIELGLIFLTFSGKFYPSVHYGSYPVVQPSEYRHIMEFVINNDLSDNYDIKKEGSVIGAVKSIGNTWMETYKDRIKDFDDEDIVYLIQQLRDRIKSFMKNIAELYYERYNSKDKYMTYDSDDLSEDNYHMADNDSFVMGRAIEKTMNTLTTTKVDYARCKTSASGRIRTDELKSIIETILDEDKNLPLIKELIMLLIVEFFNESKEKDLSSINFISTSITSKPNTKNENIIREKEILDTLLDENSNAYRKRKSRLATKLAYHKALLYYIVLTIHASSK